MAARGDHLRFYDINPAVVLVARQYFQFLSESKAQVDVVLGDGRLALEQEPPNSLDVIVLDAFSDDSIPVHLLTREAIEIDFQRLRPNGVLAIHITNRYLDLGPIVEALARSLGKQCLLIDNLPDPERGISEATWAILSDAVRTGPPVLQSSSRREQAVGRVHGRTTTATCSARSGKTAFVNRALYFLPPPLTRKKRQRAWTSLTAKVPMRPQEFVVFFRGRSMIRSFLCGADIHVCRHGPAGHQR